MFFLMRVPLRGTESKKSRQSLLEEKKMDFEEYQKKARTTAVYPDQGKNWQYPALGMSGEIGELLNKLKKQMGSFVGSLY